MKIGDIKTRPGAPQTCDSSQNFAARNIAKFSSSPLSYITPFLINVHTLPTYQPHIAISQSIKYQSLSLCKKKATRHSLMYTSKIEIEFKPRADHTYCMTILHRLDGVIISGTYGANLWISAFDLRLFLGEGVNFSDFSLYSAV